MIAADGDEEDDEEEEEEAVQPAPKRVKVQPSARTPAARFSADTLV